MSVPDEQTPATPEQIKAFLDAVLPIVEEEHHQALDGYSQAVDAHLSRLEHQTRMEQDAHNRARFFEQVRMMTYHGDEWSRQLVQWFVYILRSFITEPMDRRVAGLGYALPAGLSDQFETLEPEAERQIFATLSRPVLQVARLTGYTNVILLRQVS
jgi:hypothetical protein